MADNAVGLATFQFQPTIAPSSGGANAPANAPRLGLNINGTMPVAKHDVVRYARDLGGNGDGGLPAFIDAAFAPKIKEMQEQKFYEGFTDAAAGKSLDEINKDQPWFSRIFGPTPYARGADMFTAQKASAELEQKFTENIGELRTRPTEEVAQWLAETGKSLKSGDPYADALMNKNFMDRAGQMMSLHTKERYAWQQEELYKGQFEAQTTAGRAFNAVAQAQARLGRDHPGQSPDPEQMAVATRNFLQVFQSSPTLQNPESQVKTLVSSAREFADSGNWYALNALQDSGILKMLPPDVRDQLDTHIDTARSKAHARLATTPEAIQALTQISAMSHGPASAKQVVGAMEAFNDAYKAQTGDRDGYFKIDDYVQHAATAADATYRMYEHQFESNLRVSEAAATAAAKQRADAQDDALLAQHVGSFSLGTAVHMPGVTTDKASLAFNAALGRSPESAPLIVVGNYANKDPYVDERFKTQLQTAVTRAAGEELTDGFTQVYNQWKSIRDVRLPAKNGATDTRTGAGAALAYFGPDLNARMVQYDQMVQSRMPAELAYRRVFGADASYGDGDTRGRNFAETKDIDAAFTSAVRDLNPSWYEPTKAMGTSAQNLVMHVAGRYFDELRQHNPEMSNKSLVEEAVHAAKANGLEIAGRYAWQNLRGQKSVAQTLGMEQGVFQSYFSDALTNKLRKQGMSVDGDTSLTILRIGDDSKGARLVATAFKDGTYKTVFLNGDELKTLRNKAAEDDIARKERGMAIGMFDPNTMLPQPKM